MRRPRRQPLDIRFELAPMLDVVFVLLTFFIFAMVLSKRFTVTDVRLPEAASGAQTPAPSSGKQIVVTLKTDGSLLLDDVPTTLDHLSDQLIVRQRNSPGSLVYLAPDTASSSGELFKLMDTLAKAGLRDIRFLRRPVDAPK